MADDGIDEIIDSHKNRLLDNIIGSDSKTIFDSISLSTKDRVVKDYLMKQVREFFRVLNAEFKDVTFMYTWVPLDAYQSYYHETSNFEYIDEEVEPLYHLDKAEPLFYSSGLSEIGMQIVYLWSRKCSLGCEHATKRYMIVNMPKVLDFMAWIRTGMPARTFVKEFIPDFFYDPMQPPAKRGRPRKASRS